MNTNPVSDKEYNLDDLLEGCRNPFLLAQALREIPLLIENEVIHDGDKAVLWWNTEPKTLAEIAELGVDYVRDYLEVGAKHVEAGFKFTSRAQLIQRLCGFFDFEPKRALGGKINIPREAFEVKVL